MPPRAKEGLPQAIACHLSHRTFPRDQQQGKSLFPPANCATGHRLKQQYIDAETDAVVDRDERIKGYEVGKGEYITVSDEELAAIEIESSHTVDIENFVERSEVDSVYIAPEDKVGQEAFAVIREGRRYSPRRVV